MLACIQQIETMDCCELPDVKHARAQRFKSGGIMAAVTDPPGTAQNAGSSW